MTWLVRAIVTLVAGCFCMQLARAFVGLPSSPTPADFQFSGLLIMGGNVLFSVLDFYLTQFNQRTDQLAGVPHAPAKLARQLRQQTQRARRHISLVVTVATVLKGSGAMCGLLIPSGPLRLPTISLRATSVFSPWALGSLRSSSFGGRFGKQWRCWKSPPAFCKTIATAGPTWRRSG